MTKIIKSKERVKKFAEVFTQDKEVNSMLDLIPIEQFKDPLSKWLEPACGNGNFLIEVIRRKLAYRNENEPMDIYALKLLSSLYAFDIQQDNVDETINRIIQYLDEVIISDRKEAFKAMALSILYNNIQRDDFLSDLLIITVYTWDEHNNFTVHLEPLFKDWKYEN